MSGLARRDTEVDGAAHNTAPLAGTRLMCPLPGQFVPGFVSWVLPVVRYRGAQPHIWTRLLKVKALRLIVVALGGLSDRVDGGTVLACQVG